MHKQIVQGITCTEQKEKVSKRIMGKKLEWLVNVCMRGILGTIAMYFINGGLALWGISLGVGINLVTVTIAGILGIPGLLAVYGLGIYQLL